MIEGFQNLCLVQLHSKLKHENLLNGGISILLGASTVRIAFRHISWYFKTADTPSNDSQYNMPSIKYVLGLTKEYLLSWLFLKVLHTPDQLELDQHFELSLVAVLVCP